MSKKKTYFIVNCADYNGFKNVLFLMSSDDDRLNKTYPVVDTVKSKTRTTIVCESGDEYRLFSDWSVKKI